jgi:hypothetical protein
MADNKDNDEVYDSWEEYYKKKGEERTGFVRNLVQADLSSLDDLPRSYAGKPAVFKESILEHSPGNFILIPCGANLVTCVHSCFVFGEPGEPSIVVGILGTRRSSPFKTINVDHAVRPLSEPRTTRASEKQDELWTPTMEEFMECTNVGEFKDLDSGEEEFPAVDLWVRAQTFWLHPRVFDIVDANGPQKAGKLALDIMAALDTGSLAQVSPEQTHRLILFLWAVENLHSTKVALTDAPNSELFDNRAQEVTKRLYPEKNKDREETTQLLTSPDGGREKRKRTPKKGKSRSPGKSRKSPKRGTNRRSGNLIQRRRGRSDPSSSDNSSSSESSRSKSSRSSSSSSVTSKSSSDKSSSRDARSSSRSKSRSRSGARSHKTRSRSRSPRRRSRARKPARKKRGKMNRRGREDEHMNTIMIKNLTAITASHLKRDAKEDRKKSMLSRLAPEAAKLFDLLSAKDWNDEDPRMNSFMRDLISDKDSQRASGIMQTRTKKWSGEVSDKGLLAFFASGFAASDIQESPGGFTIFMFRPITARISGNKRDRRRQVKAMFGSTELDEEAIKYYAESDFFLPETLADLEEQIYTCVKALELFTEREGIAVEGYIHGLNMIQNGRRLFKNFIADDPLFAVKFAYLLDRVFQNFVDRLGDFYTDRKPIRRARRMLEYSQKKAIERAMMGFEVSATPRLFLPNSLRPEATDDKHRKENEDGGGKSNKKKAASETQDRSTAPAWWTKNPNAVQAWRLPEGKTYPDYFDTRVPEKKVNTSDWPKFPHHKTPSKIKGLCLKYQSKGSCTAICYMSHVDPAKMDEETRKTIDDRFKQVYT